MQEGLLGLQVGSNRCWSHPPTVQPLVSHLPCLLPPPSCSPPCLEHPPVLQAQPQGETKVTLLLMPLLLLPQAVTQERGGLPCWDVWGSRRAPGGLQELQAAAVLQHAPQVGKLQRWPAAMHHVAQRRKHTDKLRQAGAAAQAGGATGGKAGWKTRQAVCGMAWEGWRGSPMACARGLRLRQASPAHKRDPSWLAEPKPRRAPSRLPRP